jgi:hypothetical protein
VICYAIPALARQLALRLPELFSEPTPLLAMGEDRTLVLTQEQVACLLANGFLCTFPKQGVQKKGTLNTRKRHCLTRRLNSAHLSSFVAQNRAEGSVSFVLLPYTVYGCR